MAPASDSTLSNAEINWAVSKLADHELITVESFPGERIIRAVDGQRRSFSRPKAVALTAKGETMATALDGRLGVFEPMDRGDLI